MTRKEWMAVAAKVAPVAARDLVGLAGLVMITHGCAQVYVPAGWIVGGVLLSAFAFVTARAGRRT